jgi:hypothetical protein
MDVSATSLHPTQQHIERIEKEKVSSHKEATRAAGCAFFPFVISTRGTLVPQAEKFIYTVSKAAQPFHKRSSTDTFIMQLRQQLQEDAPMPSWPLQSG